MGWVCDRYFDEWKAEVTRDDLNVHFQRLYKDGRDMMSDCIRPQWEPVDDFIITVDGFNFWTETKQAKMPITGTPYTVTIEHKEPISRFVVRTKDKNIANAIWKMAKRGESFFILHNHFYVYTDEEV